MTHSSHSQRLPSRRVADTGLELTELGCGCSRIGNLHGVVSEADAQATVAAALEGGVRYFDVAPLYANGLGELRLGHALRGIPRETYALSTKVGRYYEPLPAGTPYDADAVPFQARYDYSYDGVMRAVEQSLLRLGTNYIDIAVIHDVDAFTHGDEATAATYRRQAMAGAYPALCDLRDQGVVRAVGVGVNDAKVLDICAQEANFDCFLMAAQYSLLRQDCLHPLLARCESKNIAVVVCAPFASGILAKGSGAGASYNYRPADDEVVTRVRSIEAVCATQGVSLIAAALRFPLAHPTVTCVVPGPRNAGHVRAYVDAMAERIPGAFWVELQERKLLAPDAPVPNGEA